MEPEMEQPKAVSSLPPLVPQQRSSSSKKKSGEKPPDFLVDDLISSRVDTFIKSNFAQLKSAQSPDGLSEEDESLLQTKLSDFDDIDFVLVGLKPNRKGIIYKLGTKLADRRRRLCSCCCRDNRRIGDDPEASTIHVTTSEAIEARTHILRNAYLNKLKSEYGIDWKLYETQDHYFYAVNLSFAHLGLMAQLLAYQWQYGQAPNLAKQNISSEALLKHQKQIDDIRPYKTFFFMKKHKTLKQSSADKSDLEKDLDFRYNNYFNCQNRLSFSSQLRHVLTYHFLIGARIKLGRPDSGLSPWRQALICCASPPENVSSKEIAVNLIDVLELNIFDEWLCLHQPIPKEITIPYRRGDVEAGCCSSCVYPMITCHCSSCCRPKSQSQPGLCHKLRYFWQSIWYNNCIDCVDIYQRKDENDRQYLSRVSSFRNALAMRLFRSDDDGDGEIDTEEQLKKAERTDSSLYRMYHLLPLEKLRLYFGEKIGFYFCWVELFVLSLVFPAAIGVTMFVIGLIYYSIQVNIDLNNDSGNNKQDIPGYVLAKACDNYATIGFAAVMIIWGTVFGEFWKRRNVWYKFLWRVGQLEDSELRRTNVYSLRIVRLLHSSRKTSWIMYLPSLLVTAFLVVCVWASIYLINMLDVRLSLKHCNFPPPGGVQESTTPSPQDEEDIVTTAKSWFLCNIVGVVLHSLSIVFFDKVYTNFVYPLTHLEGHQTQSSFNQSLVVKMFAFRFINNYSILFYIAFVVAPEYENFNVFSEELTGINGTDSKSINNARYKTCKQLPCMTMLSKQLFSIILTSPLIRTIRDRVLPPVINFLELLLEKCCKKSKPESKKSENDSPVKKHRKNRRNREITFSPDDCDLPPISSEVIAPEHGSADSEVTSELETQFEDLQQLSTFNWKEFTIEEFVEKTIVFGALQMFAVALPPAPFLAMLIVRIDLNFDISRMVDSFRRPVPMRSAGIGVWANVVQFLTYCGIVTNPLIVVLASSWGTQLTLEWKFWTFLIFEHVVFALRALLAALVPDEPRQLRNLRLRQRVAKDLV